MMPYNFPGPSPQLTGRADFWHPTGIPRFLLPGLTAVILLAAAVTGAVWYRGQTWAALLGFIGPNLAFLVGIGRPRGPGKLPGITVPVCNLLHRPWLPLIMLISVSLDGQPTGQAAPYAAAALGWLAHIAVDRALGFGLRARDGSIRT